MQSQSLHASLVLLGRTILLVAALPFHFVLVALQEPTIQQIAVIPSLLALTVVQDPINLV